jgi:DNA-binding NarL/FixJ family response regulator
MWVLRVLVLLATMATVLGRRAMVAIRVAVVDEHEIFRRGLVACLVEDGIDVVVEAAVGPIGERVEVAVVSPAAAHRHRFPCPLLLCGEPPMPSPAAGNSVLGLLPRSALSPGQLVGAVRAAAAGFRVDMGERPRGPAGRLGRRSLDILRLLAEGADTQEISASLRFSERTIKNAISEIERELGARSRAQAVAEGIRQGLI